MFPDASSSTMDVPHLTERKQHINATLEPITKPDAAKPSPLSVEMQPAEVKIETESRDEIERDRERRKII